MLGLLAGVQELDVLGDPAGRVERVGPAGPLVRQGDGEAAVEERDLAEPGGERLVVERQLAEHLGVGLERDGGARLPGRGGAEVLQLAALVPAYRYGASIWSS